MIHKYFEVSDLKYFLFFIFNELIRYFIVEIATKFAKFKHEMFTIWNLQGCYIEINSWLKCEWSFASKPSLKMANVYF